MKHFIGSEKRGCYLCLGKNPKNCPNCYGQTWLKNWFLPSGFCTWKHTSEFTLSDREEFDKIYSSEKRIADTHPERRA